MNVLKIHKQWIAVLLILTMAFGFPVGEASAAEIEILDQEQSLINGNVWVNQESSRFQTFTPSITGKLSGIELNLMDTNGSPGAILVNIYEESNPSVLLVTGSSSAGYKSGWVRVDFPADGPELKRNTMYRMVVSTEQGGASGFGWYASPSDDYPRGYTFAYGIDLTFRTYMIPDYSVSVEESELSVDTSSLVADGTSQATVTVRLKDRQGSYITTGGAAVAISSTLGSVGSVMDHNNGTYTATLTASTTAGTSTISATVGGNALAAKATVQFLPGPPSAVTASTGTLTPIVGASNAVNLSVSDAFGNRDTAFNGTHEVTISGYLPAPDGSYGSFNGAPLMPDSTVVGVNFTNGVATAGLILHFAQAQVISINVAGVSTPSANPLNFTPIAGNASAMKLTTDIAAPSSNGGVFTQQPVVTLLDAYGNVSVNDSSTVVTALKKDAGDWTLKGTTSVTASAGVATFSDLGATNAASITGAQLVFHAGGLAQITSLPVTLPVAPARTVSASAATLNPVAGADDEITLTVKDGTGDTDTAFTGPHDVTLSGYLQAPDGSYGSLDGVALTASPNVVTVNFTGGVATMDLSLNKAAAQTLSLSVAGVNMPAADPLTITPIAGSATEMRLTTDIAAPSSNGGTFAQQPVVTLLDDYGNVSVNDSATVVAVSKQDTGAWTLTGTTTATANAGVVTFSDLGATNAAGVNGARLAFDAAGLAGVASAPVMLPWPSLAGPVIDSVTAGDGHVLIQWAPVYGTVTYAVYQRSSSGDYDDPVATVSGSVYSYDATGLTNGTTYYFRVKATNPGGDSAASNEVSAVPKNVPAAPTQVTAVAGNHSAIVSFTPPTDNGGSAITSYEVTASPGNIVVSGTAGPITIPGLPDGVYTFTVRAINDAGRSPASQASAPLVLTTTSSGGGKEPAPAPVPAPVPTAQVPVPEAANVLINGKLEQVGTVKTAIVNNQTVTTVVIDGEKLGARLAAMQRPVVSIRVNAESDVVVGEIGGRILQRMALKQAVIEITSKRAAYTLPVSQLNFDNLKDQLGADDASTDLKVQIEIAVPTSDIMEAVNHAAAQQKSSLVAPPLNFTVRGVLEDNKVEVTGFGGYVERTIAIPNGADPLQITTAIVVEPDGTVRHVPTKVMVIDGQRYAIAKSLTNSTYAVVWHPVEFPDVSTHWAKEAVNDMGSRMIVGGTAEGIFDPDRDITRAEFAAILVSALGLELENGPSRFTDVKSTAWYSGAVNTAYAYHFIDGFENGTFHPSDKMTREQALTVLAKAMALTGLKSKLPQQETEEGLSSFTDIADASPWAMAGIADCLRAGMVSGRGANLLAPKAFMSRAEVAVTMKKLLQKSELI